ELEDPTPRPTLSPTATSSSPPSDENVSLTKTGIADEVVAGIPVSFTITVSNNGDTVSEPYGIRDELPMIDDEEWEIITSDFGEACVLWPPQDGSQLLDCGVGQLSGEETLSVTVRHPTSDETCGKISNTATLNTYAQ